MIILFYYHGSGQSRASAIPLAYFYSSHSQYTTSIYDYTFSGTVYTVQFLFVRCHGDRLVDLADNAGGRWPVGALSSKNAISGLCDGCQALNRINVDGDVLKADITLYRHKTRQLWL